MSGTHSTKQSKAKQVTEEHKTVYKQVMIRSERGQTKQGKGMFRVMGDCLRAGCTVQLHVYHQPTYNDHTLFADMTLTHCEAHSKDLRT